MGRIAGFHGRAICAYSCPRLVALEYVVREEQQKRPGRFSGFLGGVRLIFDALLLLLVMLFIGFIVFANGIDREHGEPQRTADGIAVLTGGVSRIDEAMKLLAAGNAKRVLITGVNRTTTVEELKELASRRRPVFHLLRRHRQGSAQHHRQRHRDQRVGGCASLRLDHRRDLELSYAARAAELAREMPGVTLIPYAVVDNNVHLDRWWAYPGTTKLLLSEYLKYLPALGRLGATELVRICADRGQNRLGRCPRALAVKAGWRARSCSTCCSM